MRLPHRLTTALALTAAVLSVSLISLHAQEAPEPTPPEQGAAPEVEAESLGWMAGHWAQVEEGGRFDEVWLPPAGGALQAVSRQTRDGRTGMVELSAIERTKSGLQLRIRHFDARLTPWATEDGGPGVWTLSKADGESLTFRDPSNGFPTTISYRRERVEDGPDVLVAELRGTEGPPDGLTFRLVRVE